VLEEIMTFSEDRWSFYFDCRAVSFQLADLLNCQLPFHVILNHPFGKLEAYPTTVSAGSHGGWGQQVVLDGRPLSGRPMIGADEVGEG